MRVYVNGQWQELAEATTVAALLEKLALEPRRVAIELNKRLLPRAKYKDTPLGDQDSLEIVTLVGGG